MQDGFLISPTLRATRRRIGPIWAATGVAVVVLASAGARAQPAAGQPEPSQAAYRTVTRACVQEVRRLCPALEGNPSQPRNWAICLRPYRASLSFGCRRAVGAVIP